MTRTTHYARTSALPAIAAALALSSTPLLAQAVQPVIADPAVQPAPATEPTPPVTDTTPVVANPSATVTPDASVATTVTATTAKTRTVRPAKVATPKPTVSSVKRTRATQQTVATAPAVPPQAPAPSPAAESAVAPAVDLNSKPANPPVAPVTTSMGTDETLPIAGGALALLVLGGGAYALLRRRRRADEVADEEWVDESAMEQEHAMAAPTGAEPRHDPIFNEQPAIVAPSAFAWGGTAPTESQAGRDADDDRLPDETWVERAYRGPSATNPSVSLKNRLRRAAFFDKRERDVAAGVAEPVDPDAGLPDAIADQQERELA